MEILINLPALSNQDRQVFYKELSEFYVKKTYQFQHYEIEKLSIHKFLLSDKITVKLFSKNCPKFISYSIYENGSFSYHKQEDDQGFHTSTISFEEWIEIFFCYDISHPLIKQESIDKEFLKQKILNL